MRCAHNGQAARGQTILIVVLVLSTFLLGFIALAVDFSNLWFHRQSAQAAADAACQAAALDVYLWTVGSATGNAGFTPAASPGGDFLCSASPNAAPCKYAEFNGYKATTGGLQADAQSQEVAVTFPASLPGVTAPPASLATVPFVRVQITDRARVFFASLFTGRHTQDVVAYAGCGLANRVAPIPIIVLHPTLASSLSVQGTPDIIISGGPVKSIQVNSNSCGSKFGCTNQAVNIGGSATVDLTSGGPNYSGSSLGTFGGPGTAPGGFLSGTPVSQYWQYPAPIISDPFASLAIPTKTSDLPDNPAPLNATYGDASGCPDIAGCYEYLPGNYTGDICVGHSCPGFKTYQTAVFDAGLYIVAGQLNLASGSTVRPSKIDNSEGTLWGGPTSWGGTMFYFKTSTNPLAVDSNSGKDSYVADVVHANIVDGLPAVQCPAGPALVTTGAHPLPSTYLGNILLAPCAGPYGSSDGKSRGMLFFGNRANATAANWGGGGSFLLAGNMYFHQCKADGTGTNPCSDPSSGGYGASMTLQGGSGSSSYVLGDIVTDVLQLGGTSAIHMNLNPNSVNNILTVQLMQ